MRQGLLWVVCVDAGQRLIWSCATHPAARLLLAQTDCPGVRGVAKQASLLLRACTRVEVRVWHNGEVGRGGTVTWRLLEEERNDRNSAMFLPAAISGIELSSNLGKTPPTP